MLLSRGRFLPLAWFIAAAGLAIAQTTPYYQIRHDLGVPLSSFAGQILARMDFNGDGREDVLVGGNHIWTTNRTPIYLLLNLGNGTFREATGDHIVGSLTALNPIAAVADLNADGVPDVAIYDAGNMEIGQAPGVGGFYGAEPQLLLSRPGRKWIVSDALAVASQAASQFNSRNVHLKEVHAGDFDGDGKIDLFVESGGGYQNLDPHIVMNLGNETFRVDVLGVRLDHFMHKGPVGKWRYGAYAVADMDGDGAPDLVMGTWRNENNDQDDARSRVAYNDGTGHFSMLRTTALPNSGWNRDFTYVYRAAAIDFDDDGRRDIVFVHVRGNSGPSGNAEVTTGVHFQFLRNLGNRQFADVTAAMMIDQSAHEVIMDPPYNYQNYGWPQKIDHLDVNGDGRKDLILSGSQARLGTVSPRIYFRSAAGTFEAANPNMITAGELYHGQYLAPMALNGDTKLDFYMLSAQFGPDGQFGTGDDFHIVVPILALSSPVLPTIVAPASATIQVGGTLSLTPTITGTAPFSYQWYFSGSPLAGATSATLNVSSAGLTHQGTYRLRVSDGVAHAFSGEIAVVVAGVRPTVTASPQSQDVSESGTLQLSVVATGSAPLSYQWRKGGQILPGETGTTYTKTNVAAGDAGNYTVEVSNPSGSVLSLIAVIRVFPVTAPPAIVTGPAGGIATLGSALTLSVTASGEALAYQWFKDGVAIAGAADSRRTIPALSLADAGRYTVRVSNPAGTVFSQPALVHVPVGGGFPTTPYVSTYSSAQTALPGFGQVILGEFDFNQDGRMDLIVGGEKWGSSAKSPISILVNLGTARFRVATTEFFEGAAPMAHMPVAAIADLNGDGVPDFAIYDAGDLDAGQQSGGGYLGEEPMLYLSKPGRTWAPSSALRDAALAASAFGSGRVHLREAIAGDIDGDGDVDLWIESSGGYQNPSSHFVLNQGNGAFTLDGTDARIAHALLRGTNSAWRYGSYALADFDGDGRLDLAGGTKRSVNSGQDDARSRIWWNDGTGRFPAAGSTFFPLANWNNGYTDVRKLLATDLNGDGRPDLVVAHTRSHDPADANANQTGRYLQVLINQGSRGFEDATARYFFDQSAEGSKTAPPYGNNNNAPQLILHRDLNGDGLADLFLAGVNTPLCREAPALYLRTASGGFEPFDWRAFASDQIYFGELAYPIELNGDGKIDYLSLDLRPGADGNYGTGDEFHATVPTLTGVVPMPPHFRQNPLSQIRAAGSAVALAVDVAGAGPLAYQWYRNGIALPGATQPTYAIATLGTAEAGAYFARVRDDAGNANSQAALVIAGLPGHALAEAIHVPGGTVAVGNTATPAGATALLWQVLLPPGFRYVSDNLASVIARPTVGQADLLEWSWTAVPASPLSFTYVLSAPTSASGARPLTSLVTYRHSSATVQAVPKPDPMILAHFLPHRADTNRDYAIGLLELTRVIQLYNTRNGSVRTGAYKIDVTGEDGFAPDATRPNSTAVTLATYHSADTRGGGGGTAPDGKIDLLEITRMIELFNHRSGTVRTGQYRAQADTEDGFAPGP